MRRNRCALLGALTAGCIASQALAAPSLRALGDLPGGAFVSYANGISGDGSTIVGVSSSASGSEAFRWTSTDGMVGLGELAGGGFDSVADAVSDDGSVVVGDSWSGSGRWEAFRWTSADGMVGLGDLAGPEFNSHATAVSGDGSTIVGAGRSSYGSEAFRWTSTGGMVGLGDLPGGTTSSAASGVSGDGSVVVGYSSSASGPNNEAFRWTSTGGMVGLGDLPGGSDPLVDPFYSVAYAVSDDGSMVVGGSNAATGVEAFRWTSTGGMVGLGVPVGGTDSIALGVSGDGSVVVGGYHIDPLSWETYAFRWTEAGGMEPLWDALVAAGVDPAADGWTRLTQASAVSLDGSTIAGVGLRYGNNEAFVAVVPEPACLGLIGAAVLLCRRRWWRLKQT